MAEGDRFVSGALRLQSRTYGPGLTEFIVLRHVEQSLTGRVVLDGVANGWELDPSRTYRLWLVDEGPCSS